MSEEKYKIRYKIQIDYNEDNGFSADEIYASQDNDPRYGGADNLICISIIKSEDGNFSILPFSFGDKESEPANSKDFFKAWIMLASALSNDPDLTHFQRYIAKEAFSTVQDMIMGCRVLKEKKDSMNDN